MAFVDTEVDQALREAEKQRSGDALYKMGLLYSTGQGVELDYVQAHKWFNLAAMAGSEAARIRRAELADEMSSEEIAAAQREARKWISAHQAA